MTSEGSETESNNRISKILEEMNNNNNNNDSTTSLDRTDFSNNSGHREADQFFSFDSYVVTNRFISATKNFLNLALQFISPAKL